MGNRCRIIFTCAIALIGFTAQNLQAQQKREDRWKYLDPSTPVTDDTRRVPIPPGAHGPDGTIVLRGGRIFDGTGKEAYRGTIVIERNRIKSILPAAANDFPQGARMIDVSGKTVMPGLIDLHTHLDYVFGDYDDFQESQSDATLRGVERLRYFIESGITSVRDVASRGEVPFRLKAWVAQNLLPGPRVFPAGQLITAKGGHGADGLSFPSPPNSAIRVASGPDDWREAVREQFDRGADVIKVASHFSRTEINAAVEEAHALGLKVTCDCETFYIQWAVEAGVDCVEHPLPRSDETIRWMAEKNVQSVPTIITYALFFANHNGGYFGSTSRRFTFSNQANLDVLRRMKKAGIKMGIGTDLINTSFQNLPAPYIQELKYFVQAGYTIPEALVAATKTSAEILDMAERLGTLEPGKLADVLVVAGQPDRNLDDLANVDLVLRDGNVLVENGHLARSRHVSTPMPALQ